MNAQLHGYEVDLLWRKASVIAELDGQAFHATAQAFERDRRRDAELTTRGVTTLRFTWKQVRDEDGFVARCLAATLVRSKR